MLKWMMAAAARGASAVTKRTEDTPEVEQKVLQQTP